MSQKYPVTKKTFAIFAANLFRQTYTWRLLGAYFRGDALCPRKPSLYATVLKMPEPPLVIHVTYRLADA